MRSCADGIEHHVESCRGSERGQKNGRAKKTETRNLDASPEKKQQQKRDNGIQVIAHPRTGLVFRKVQG